jgi:hypothetical protein
MNMRHPPKVATWLLRHLDLGTHSESLAGDLLEQYAQGRNGLWYWRQVAAAVWTHTWRARPHGRPLIFMYLACSEVVIALGLIFALEWRLGLSLSHVFFSILIPLSISILWIVVAARRIRSKAAGSIGSSTT